jgi:hypothetical protein
MRSIFAYPGHATIEFGPEERAERLAAASAEQQRRALVFLSGYAPGVFDTILDAVEPEDEDAPDELEGSEPCCAFCMERVGIFLHLGLDWQHYRGEEASGPFEIFDPGHDPVLSWRQILTVAAAS